MPLSRRAAWTLLAAAGCAVLAARTAAQPPSKDEPPRPPGNYTEVSVLKGEKTIPAEKMAAAKTAFKSFAEFQAAFIKHPKVYTAPQEFRPEVFTGPPPPAPPPNLDAFNTELLRHILIPQPAPTLGTRVDGNNADYIRELGTALDVELAKVIKDEADPIVRINATRLLATACKSGARVHWATVTDLVTNPNYPPEVKNYAYQAAGNLLAAYDFADYRSRRHAHEDKVVAALVKGLQDAIFPPPELVTGGKKRPDPTPEQLAVTGYIRRNATRALAQCRFASFPNAPGGALYPAHTLARVATSDPALQPAPGPAEVAEAVMGLCNVSPTKGYNTDLAAEAVAVGLVTFAGPRAGDPNNRTTAWRVYAARLTDMLKIWRGTFDTGYDPAKPYVVDANSVPKFVEMVATNAMNRLLTPMDKVGPDGKADVTVKVDLLGMQEVVRQIQASPNRPTVLFRDVPATALGPAPVKN